MRVKDMMVYDISAVFEDETVERVIHILSRQSVSGIPVVDDNMKVVGFISENDIIKAAVPSYFMLLQSASFIPDTNQLIKNLSRIKDKPISDVMSKPPITVNEDDPLITAADLLIRHGLKTLPVIDKNSQLVGIIRRIDVLRGVFEGKEEL
ncbi:MAG TPA: CBS domain-containing protein [Thermotoga sp.]|nr:MAG: CBS domain-containing protein [Thermotogota bacterium]RKX52920.1 MAG: CBS domain-containing protein [Thermotoga sp.]RKX57427.1 MAG: CBS domain-containing protein [Thermotoga sp.]HDG61807.1 CBS domain-containing protein [Thermotoga sp.]